jgi:hypothetical protein
MAEMKKKGAAKRFDDLAIKNASRQRLSWWVSDLAIEWGMPYGGFAIRRPTIDWGNLDFRAKIAETSLRLSDHDTDNGLRQAFVETRLDPDNPESWAILLRFFASAHFGKVKRSGKRVWDWQRWSQLLADFAAVESSHPTFSDEDICRIIKKAYPTAYADQTTRTLRRTLQYARNPKYNLNLQFHLRIAESKADSRVAKREPKTRRRNVQSNAMKMAFQAIAKELHRAPERQKVNLKRSAL